jgi:UDP-N-acetylmuramate--L-alanine ligase
MAGVALLLSSRGCKVSGCDLYPSLRTQWLEENGITFFAGHSPSHISEDISDFVVTPAVQPSNPELIKAKEAGLSIRYRGEVLAEIVSAADGIAVCGTHGKTTTSTFIACLLKNLGVNPSWCIGGESPSLGPVANVGDSSSPLVVEADESDGTLALYHPVTTVLNAVDFDHLEHFDSEEDYFNCYRSVLRQTKGTVIVCRDHEKAYELALECSKNVITFGFDERADVRASDWQGIPVSGKHNVVNALGAIAVALSRGFSREEILRALPASVASLPDRRFEMIVERDGVRVISDYAHHPAELECAVKMACESSTGRVRVIFQPHRYSRTKALLNQFPPAFDEADEVVLVPVYSAFENPILGGDIADLYAAFRQRKNKSPIILARNALEAWEHIFLTLKGDDTVLIAGAGDIVHIVPSVRSDILSDRFKVDRVFTPLSNYSFFRTGGATCGKIYNTKSSGANYALPLGQGSNTWISDCVTSQDFIRLEDGAGIAGAQFIKGREHLNFMRGIPGTIGGWVKMNAGAFGHSIGEYVEYVIADGKKLLREECGFSYRHSEIPGLITDVKLLDGEFPPVPIPSRPIFPPRTCGSVFKNPSDVSAGRLLEEAGAKEMKVGGARVWENHANVIVAEEGCTSSDILALARLMYCAVREKFNVNLEPEIRGLEMLS